MDDYVGPVFFTDRAKELNDKFYLILNEVVAKYPNYKINPDGLWKNKSKMAPEEITNFNAFNESMNKMKKLQNEYFLYYNNVTRESERLSVSGRDVDDKISVFNNKINTLTTKIKSLKASGYSAEGLLNDTQLTRNQLFFGNIFLFIVMSGGGYLYYKKMSSASS